jgi:hypothetical protein
MAENATVLTSDIERLICGIGGVSASKVVTDEEGRIVEIHVLADMSRSPKQIVRDIQSSTMAAFGVPVDYKTISIAQIQRDMEPSVVVQSPTPDPVPVPVPVPVRAAPRLLLAATAVRAERASVEVSVTLSFDDRPLEGVARGASSERGRRTAAAAACLEAVRGHLGAEGLLQVLEVQKIRIAGLDAIDAAVAFQDGDRELVLLGSAAVRPGVGEEDAVVRAVLDALNRLLGRNGMAVLD